jgi:RNA polymerase sigma factor (sigma-70 family)
MESAMTKQNDLARDEVEKIYHAHYGPLVGILTRLTSDRGRAEELASEVLLRLFSRPELVRTAEKIDGWLYRTAMNLGLDAIRMQSRRTKYEQAANTELLRGTPQTTPLSETLRRERQQQVRQVLSLLARRDAELLLLRHMDLSYQEMARITGIPPQSIGTLLARAMARFERQYRKLYGGDE